MSSPAEIARETMKRLAVQRIAPTPEAYAATYAEISGQAAPAGHPLLTTMKQLVADLRETSQGRRAAQPLAKGLEESNWDQVRQALMSLAQVEQGEPQSWPDMLRELLRLWEMRHEGLTQARKRESLDHVLTTFGSDPGKLYPRLRALTKSWADGASAGDEVLVDNALLDEAPAAAESAPSAAAKAAPKNAQDIARIAMPHVALPEDEAPALRELLAQTMTYAVTQRLGYSEEMEQEAASLAERCRHAVTLGDINQISAHMKQFWIRLELRGETLEQMVKGLLTLLQLLVHNMSDLMDDDRWVKGQVERMQDILNQPLSPQALEQASEGFREFVYRQGALKSSLDEAKEAIRNMVHVFIDRLSVMSESTGMYSEKIEGYAQQIKVINDLPHLSSLVENLMQDTRALQSEMVRSHEELQVARKQVLDYEQRVHELQESLSSLSELISHDPLTSVLNRRGMEQVFDVEVSRCERKGKPLALAVLDIDNFKQLNDLLGHQAGDEALQHLSKILRQVIRPSDAVARYGGEEFVIILPETDASEAERAIVRVQRELTKRFFMHNHEKVLITFSAGVTVRRAEEARDALIARADEGMYQAKRSGKNRVVLV